MNARPAFYRRSGEPQADAYFSEPFQASVTSIRLTRRMTPDGCGPGRVSNVPYHVMDVQLGHDISQRADVQLVPRKRFQQKFAYRTRLVEQCLALRCRQFVYFSNRCDTRHQNDPGVAPFVE